MSAAITKKQKKTHLGTDAEILAPILDLEADRLVAVRLEGHRVTVDGNLPGIQGSFRGEKSR